MVDISSFFYLHNRCLVFHSVIYDGLIVLIQSGFFAFIRTLSPAQTSTRGYNILLETLVQGSYTTVSGITYNFDKRKVGVSKLGVNNAIDYLHHRSSLFVRSGELR
jgi:hypothetical protein